MEKKVKLNIKTRHGWLIVPGLLIILALSPSCKEEYKVRKYSEAPRSTIDNRSAEEQVIPLQDAAETSPPISAARPQWKWVTPDGWTEETPSLGMRIATFTINHENRSAECSVVVLPGEAGGLEANTGRWLNQILPNLEPVQAEQRVQELLATEEKLTTVSGWPVSLVDFSSLLPNPGDISIIAAIIRLKGDVLDSSIFIKIFGEKSLLIENKGRFREFCRSFSLQELSAEEILPDE